MIAVLALLASVQSASATPRTWTGSGGSSWNNAANWNPAGVPTSADDLTISGSPVIQAVDAFALSVQLQNGVTINDGGSLTLSQGGSSTWTGGFIDIHDAGIITLNGTFNAQGDGLQMRLGGAGGTAGPIRLDIASTGVFTKTSGTGLVNIGIPVDNDGEVSPTTGRIKLLGAPAGHESAGAFAPVSPGGVALAGGMSLSSGADVEGSGTIRIDGAAAMAAGGAFDIGTLQLNGGTLNLDRTGHTDALIGSGTRAGMATLTVDGPATTTLSNISFNFGQTSFAADVSITNNINVNASTLVFGGATSWNAGFIDMHDSGTVRNDGTFTPVGGGLQMRIGEAGFPNGPRVFLNSAGATFAQNTSSSVVVQADFTNSGAVDVQSGLLSLASGLQSGGTWDMHANTLQTGTTLAVSGGTFKSAGTVMGNVNLTGGVIEPGSSPGTLTITGNYQQTGGALRTEIAGNAPGQFDRVEITGTASLDGTLDIVTVIPFDPALTDTFQILSAGGGLTGTWPTLTGAQLTGKRYSASYDANNAVLSLTPGPANTGRPTVTPTAAQPGTTLTCSPGTWTGLPTFQFAWLSDGSQAGTGTTYVVVATDVGKNIVCRVTATNAGGSASADSDPVVPSAAPIVAPPVTTTPTTTTATKTPAPPVAEPLVITAKQIFTLPVTKRCVSRRRFRVRVKQPANVKLVSVTVVLNGKKVKTNKGSRVTAPVDLRGLPKGSFKLKVTAVTSTGRKISNTRTYRTCRPKK